jgi:tetratricopeptide (TPR) repeat protein
MTSYRLSFLTLVATLLITPLFFIPGGSLDLGNAKSFVAVLGIGLAAVFFIFAFLRSKEVALPRHHLLSAALLLPVVYLLSALLTTPSSLSLLGYNLEVGTFGSILLGTIALFLAASIFVDTSRALQAVLALFASFSVLALFVALKVVLGGDALAMGNFFTNMGNPLGSWMDLAVAFGLLATLSMFTLGMLPMKGAYKAVLYVAFFLSTALLVVVHYAPVFALTLAASVCAFLYFVRIEKGFSSALPEGGGEPAPARRFTFLPIFLGVVSLIFLINPVISGGRTLGDVVSGAAGVSNAEIRPTLSTTLSISKAVLSQRSLLGSGPNTFSSDWLSFKPSDVNATPYWAVEFPFGAGFVTTQVATTGMIGSILWLAFFAFLLALALKVIGNIPESRATRFALVSTLAVTLFLWTASFLYIPSLAMFLAAFAFTGVLLALCREASLVATRPVHFPHSPVKQVAVLATVLALVGVIYLGWIEGEKTLAAFHFQRAVALGNTAGTPLDTVEDELLKAINLAPLDTYYLAVSQINFSKAQVIASSATGTPEETQAAFQDALGRSVQAARAAVNANPASYGNWVALGNVYSSLVPDPIKLDGAYESAQYAYNEAFKRNPSNPQLPLLLAQLELNKGNADQARSYIQTSLALKSDYPDAYILLAQLEVAAKNTQAAIASAEQVAALLPNDVGVHFELGLLKLSAGDAEGAASALQNALKLSPDYANAKYYLALAEAQLGNKDQALAILQGLKATNPDSAELDAAIEALNAPATSAAKK